MYQYRCTYKGTSETQRTSKEANKICLFITEYTCMCKDSIVMNHVVYNLPGELSRLP